MNSKIPVNLHIKNLKQLIAGKKTDDNSKLLSEQFSSELSSIQDLMTYVDNDDPKERKIIMGELGTFMKIKEFEKGHFFKNIYSINHDFIMLLKGKIMEYEIKYIKMTMTFKEYILYLTNLYLLNEKEIYWDCLERNCDAFPFNIFKYYIEHWLEGIKRKEEIKKENKSWVKDINVLEICKELNMKGFEFMDEVKKIKNDIKNSFWFNFDTKNKRLTEEDYSEMINSFFDLYNFNLDKIVNTKEQKKEEIYKVCLPYYYQKRILNPISFIGDLNRPIRIRSYSSLICLSDCFVVFIDKTKINPRRSLFKYIYNNKLNYISENLFKKHHLFKNISVDYLNQFGKHMQIINLKKDQILFKQDEPHQGAYIIMKGSLQLETFQSYRDLMFVDFLLMHSLDYCPDYFSKKKKKELENNYEKAKNNKNYLNGYYDYNSDLNILMKNPLFKEKSKIKNNIIFCIYKKNDILGLGEIFDYKNKINIFTAKSLSNDTEVIFIPKEIFQGLLTIESFYNTCGNFTEEKTNLLGKCIDKYKFIFEKKIEMSLNNKKIQQKIRLYNNKRQNFGTLLDKIKLSGLNTKKNQYISDADTINFKNINKSQIIENNKNNLSYYEKSKVFENNNNIDINEINNNIENINYFLLRKSNINNQNKKNYLNKMHHSTNLISSTSYETINQLKLNDVNTKFLFNSKYPSIKDRNNQNQENYYFNSEKKRLRSSIPVYMSYDSNLNCESSKGIIPKNKRSKKLNLRSLSAQRYDEQEIKKSISDYQNNYKEMRKYYNNMEDKSRSFFPNYIRLSNKNYNNDIDSSNNYIVPNNIKKINLSNNNQKIIINKFSSSSLFRKNHKREPLSKSGAI